MDNTIVSVPSRGSGFLNQELDRIRSDIEGFRPLSGKWVP